MVGVVVAAATAADWRDLRELRLAALKDSPEAFWSSYEDAVATDDDGWRSWAASGTVFLARLEDGRAVGMAAGKRYDEPARRHERHLIAMWIAPEARSRGVAGELIDAVVAWARADGATSLGLWVVDGNVTARRVYERAGFTLTGENQPFPGDDPRTESRMVKTLVTAPGERGRHLRG